MKNFVWILIFNSTTQNQTLQCTTLLKSYESCSYNAIQYSTPLSIIEHVSLLRKFQLALVTRTVVSKQLKEKMNGLLDDVKALSTVLRSL